MAPFTGSNSLLFSFTGSSCLDWVYFPCWAWLPWLGLIPLTVQINHLFYIVCTVSLYHLACAAYVYIIHNLFSFPASLPPHCLPTFSSLPLHFLLTSPSLLYYSLQPPHLVWTASLYFLVWIAFIVCNLFSFPSTFFLLSHRFFTSFSLPSRCLLTSSSCHCLLTSSSFPSHCLLTPSSLFSHFCIALYHLGIIAGNRFNALLQRTPSHFTGI